MTKLKERSQRSEMEVPRYGTMDHLRRLCEEHEEESHQLEFKSCNELKAGIKHYGKDGKKTTRSIEDVKEELARDVSSFLNSAGGTIIYGIRERKDRADTLDTEHAFKREHGHDINVAKVTEWIRSHVQPPPSVQVASIPLDPSNPDGPWFLVIDIPQGEQAYMAPDNRFHSRVGNLRKPMEQYEVVDVMNRTRGAALVLDLDITDIRQPSSKNRTGRFSLKVEITSSNLIASEYGALKLTVASPMRFVTDHIPRGFDYRPTDGLQLEGSDKIADAQSVRARWGADLGSVIFPDDRFDFHGNSFMLEIPIPGGFPEFTYVFEARLFTANRRSVSSVYFIEDVLENGQPTGKLELVNSKQLCFAELAERYWDTWHRWRKTSQCSHY